MGLPSTPSDFTSPPPPETPRNVPITYPLKSLSKQLTSLMLMMMLSPKLMDLLSVPLPGTPEPMTTVREPLGMNGSTTTSLASMSMESLLLSSDAVTKPDTETTTATPQENFTISSPPRAPRSSE